MDIAVPEINNNAMTGGYWSDIQDGLSFGLDSWLKVEAFNAQKDASGYGQKDLNNTVEVQTPQVVQAAPTPAKTMQQQLAQGLQMGTGTLAAVVGGVALLWFLTKK